MGCSQVREGKRLERKLNAEEREEKAAGSRSSRHMKAFVGKVHLGKEPNTECGNRNGRHT